ncbi:hypothetical protein DFH08DRAFT_810089 [Mycena albidolilacea]|uniref:Uncharacterized protein n=1 Tax=Mycena albidolilacea TaxID=1033008 RepID=A0AAD7EPI8_9AGAR|nr:hypothetical protein DFH08DRAFT_810089 [Mycena albidolilacea]
MPREPPGGYRWLTARSLFCIFTTDHRLTLSNFGIFHTAPSTSVRRPTVERSRPAQKEGLPDLPSSFPPPSSHHPKRALPLNTVLNHGSTSSSPWMRKVLGFQSQRPQDRKLNEPGTPGTIFKISQASQVVRQALALLCSFKSPNNHLRLNVGCKPLHVCHPFEVSIPATYLPACLLLEVEIATFPTEREHRSLLAHNVCLLNPEEALTRSRCRCNGLYFPIAYLKPEKTVGQMHLWNDGNWCRLTLP